MPRNELTFINHACFIVQTDCALLLADPWLEGPAFNNGCVLLDQSAGSEQVIARLNMAGLPVFVWLSHAHPERLPAAFIKQFRERFRGIATFLVRHTLDKRAAALLRQQGFNVAECGEGQAVALGRGMQLTVFPVSDGGSWCAIRSGARTIVNLNDCPLATPDACRAARARLDKHSTRVDVMLTQFGYAGWVGNPDQPALHKAAAHERLTRMALQASHFKPRLLVPFASFALYAHPGNACLNDAQNTPQAVAGAAQLARYAHLVRFLRPGSKVDLGSDSAASLTLEHERAVAHWMALLARERQLLPAQPGVPSQEVKVAIARHRCTLAQRLRGLPALLEAVGAIAPLAIHMGDLGETVQVSHRRGARTLAPGAPWDVAMGSADALYLFKNESGYGTALMNGRFRLARPEAEHKFRRFFLPQRMARDGYDGRRPARMLRYLLRNAASLAGRRIRAALRLA